jgi:hypothetical protein
VGDLLSSARTKGYIMTIGWKVCLQGVLPPSVLSFTIPVQHRVLSDHRLDGESSHFRNENTTTPSFKLDDGVSEWSYGSGLTNGVTEWTFGMDFRFRLILRQP